MFPNDDLFDAEVSLESQRTGVVDEPVFRILLIGDYAGHGTRKPLSERPVYEVDRDEIAAVMRKMATSLVLDVNGETIELAFEHLNDFHPDEIFRRTPLFAELRSLRKRLLDANEFHSAAREVRNWAENTDTSGRSPADNEAETAPPADNLLDAILSQPDGGAPKPRIRTGASKDLSDLVNSLVRPYLVSVDENEQAALVKAVDTATGELMANIIKHPDFRSLEAAWRGLDLVARRTETSNERKIFVLDVTKNELQDDVKSSDGRLYDALFDGEPWAAVFGNYSFEPNVDDVAALIRIGKIAAELEAPFIAHMSPAVLGIRSLAETPDQTKWVTDSASNEAKLWAALRGQPEADHLAMAMPRIMARVPYGRDTEPLESFDFEEIEGTPSNDDILWMNGSFAAAVLLAQSHAENGWGFSGRLAQDLPRMPVYTFTAEDGDASVIPAAEVQLSQAAAEELMERGLMPIVSFKNSDHIRLVSWQSIADGMKMLRGNW